MKKKDAINFFEECLVYAQKSIGWSFKGSYMKTMDKAIRSKLDRKEIKDLKYNHTISTSLLKYQRGVFDRISSIITSMVSKWYRMNRDLIMESSKKKAMKAFKRNLFEDIIYHVRDVVYNFLESDDNAKAYQNIKVNVRKKYSTITYDTNFVMDSFIDHLKKSTKINKKSLEILTKKK